MEDKLLANETNVTVILNDYLAFKTTLNQVFLVTNGIFVLLMQPGFALLECGAVRSKNATNILVKNMLDALIAGIAYWIFGYAFAYGKGNAFLGYEHFALATLPEDEMAKWFFQYVFAATAATIVSGSLAERCDTTAYFTYSFLITAFIYPVVSHWAWTDEGWLHTGHYHDFAGSGVVHVVGGTCAMVGAIILGPRIGRIDKDTGEMKDLRGHSLPLSITGGMILLVGFLPFNGGSLGHIDEPGDGRMIARAVSNTTIAGCFGGLVVLSLVRGGLLGKPKVLSAVHAMNGALAGMVGICSGVNNMHLWGAAVTGAIGGIFYIVFHMAVLKLKIDDPLDAIAVHLGGGSWGLLAAPIFGIDDGIILSGSSNAGLMLAWNIAGGVAIFTWSALLSIAMFGGLRLAGLLRVAPEIEMRGLDIMKHNEPAYPAESWFEEQYQTMNRLHKRNSSITPFDISLPPHMRKAKESLDHVFSVSNSANPKGHAGTNNKAFVSDEPGPAVPGVGSIPPPRYGGHLPGAIPTDDANNHSYTTPL